MSYRFSLAPMSPTIRGITIVLLFLPPIFGIWAMLSHTQVAIIAFLLISVLYGATWFGCRPSYFVVSPSSLEIVFPLWRRRISLEGVSHSRLISQEAFRQEFGLAVRVGVGGLWGGFGWLWTSQRGFVEFYVSQLDNLVLIERLTGNSLLITPEQPQQFVDVIQTIRS